MSHICAYTMHAISQWKHVQRNRKLNNAHPRIELFGCDILMDENFKIYLMEANTQVGLFATPETFPDESCKAKDCTKNGCVDCKGVKKPNFKKINKLTEDVINTSMDILQLDCEYRDLSKKLINLHEIHKNSH